MHTTLTSDIYARHTDPREVLLNSCFAKKNKKNRPFLVNILIKLELDLDFCFYVNICNNHL